MPIYLDSCILIYQVEEAQPWFQRVAQAMQAVSRSEFVISHLVRLECLVRPLQLNDNELLDRFNSAFSSLPFADLAATVFDRAARIRAIHRIKTPDALHLAAAIEHGCEEFWTNDDRLAGVRDEIAMRVFR